VPWHRGLELQVDVFTEDLDAAIELSKQWAEAVLTLLSAVGRAASTPAEAFVAYEITPEIREREFAQWYRDLPIMVGKRRSHKQLLVPCLSLSSQREVRVSATSA
jgi:hypothetical protein